MDALLEILTMLAGVYVVYLVVGLLFFCVITATCLYFCRKTIGKVLRK